MQKALNFPQKTRGGLASVQTRPLPSPADANLVRQVENEAQAVAVAMHGMKLSAVALEMEISEPYLSRIRSGQRPFPASKVDTFCRVTGTLLLKQVMRRIELERQAEEEFSAAHVIARLAEQLRATA